MTSRPALIASLALVIGVASGALLTWSVSDTPLAAEAVAPALALSVPAASAELSRPKGNGSISAKPLQVPAAPEAPTGRDESIDSLGNLGSGS